MSIHEQINLLKSTSCFSSMSTRYSDVESKYRKSFHDSIKDSKNTIFNLFEREPVYKDKMPIISKSNRGNIIYHKFVKSNIKSERRKSAFFIGLMKAIKEVQKEKQKQETPKIKSNFRHYYIIPKIDILRKKREKYGSYLSKKNKTVDNEIKVLKKSNSTLNTMKLNENVFFKGINNFQTNNITNSSNANDPIFSLETLQTFNPNNEGSMQNNLKELNELSNFNLTKLSLITQPRRVYQSSTKKLSRQSVNLSDYFQKQEKFLYQKKKRMNKILDKCEESLTQAKNVAEDFEKNSKQKDPLDIHNKFKNAMQSDDQKVIEDMDKGNKKYQEYQKIQEEKFMHLKKNIDIKLSDEYAYMIRNELQEIFGVNGTVLAYQLYSKDMTKLKEKISKNLENEKKTIRKVKDLLEDSYRKKEFLKYKVDTLRMKQEKLNQIKNFNFNKKDNLNKNADDEELKGNLLPKIVQLKDQCYQDIGYNFVK